MKINKIFKISGMLCICLLGLAHSLLATTTIDETLDVGAIDGAHAVNLTGAFTYTIPIKIPEGTMGMQPNLSLNYNSQSGNGNAGYGWNLSGVSAISRINKNIYYDDAVSAPDLSNSDALTLDGNRLLYDKNITEGGKTVRSYYTEMESFQRIRTNNNAELESFTVKTKDGKTIEYGNTADAKLMTEDGFTTLMWYINKVTDRNGNYMIYHYTNYGRQVVLSRIEYTGNNFDDPSPKPYTKVNFTYKNRSNKSNAYMAGSKMDNYKLLDEIEITTNYSTHYKSYRLLHLEDDNLKEFQEWSIKLKDDMTTDEKTKRLNSLTFEYGSTLTEIDNTDPKLTENLYNYNKDGAVYIPGNFNNDGLTDYLVLPYEFKNDDKKKARYSDTYILINKNSERDGTTGFTSYNIGNNTVSNSQESIEIKELFRRDGGEWLDFNKKALYPLNDIKIMTGDMNGDGIDDIVVGKEIVSKQYIYYYALLSTGVAGFTLGNRRIQLDDENYNPINPFEGPANQHVATLLDADGDGRLEFFALKNSPARYFIHSFDDRINLFNKCLFDDCSDEFNIAYDTGSIRVHDYDGDGKSEVTYYYAYLTNFAVDISFDLNSSKPAKASSTIGWTLADPAITPELVKRERITDRFLDLNGDGKIDKIEIDKSGIKASVSKGNGEYVAIQPGIPYIYSFSDLPDYYKFYYFIDVNSDGFTDCLIFNTIGKSIDIYLNDGEFTTFTKHSFPYKGCDFSWCTVNHPHLFQFVDLNGDGILEIQAVESNSNRNPQFYDLNIDTKLSRQLKNVYDSFGERTSITYTPLSKNSNYNIDNKPGYPYRTIDIPIYVVDNLIYPTGIPNNANRLRYEYSNLIINLEGKGLLGFTSIIETDEVNKTKTVTKSILDKDNAMLLPNKTTTLLTTTEPNTNLTETSTSYTVVENAGSKWLRLDESVSFDFTNESKTTIEYLYYDNIPNYLENFGKIKNSTTKVYDILNNNETLKYTTTEVITYFDCDWWTTYLPKSMSTTLNRSGYAGENTRTVNYEYDAINGFLTKETTDPNKVNELITTYENPDKFGNPLLTKIAANKENGKPERSKRVVFDYSGRFIVEEYNNNDNLIMKGTIDQKWGLPLSVTDVFGFSQSGNVKGNTTLFTYDNYGRLNTTTDYLGNTATTAKDWSISSNAEDTGYNIETTYKVAKTKLNTPDATIFYDKFDREVLTKTEIFGDRYIYSYKKYDRRGRTMEEIGPFETGDVKEKTTFTNYTYDDLNRVTSSKYKDRTTIFKTVNYNYPTRMVEMTGSSVINKTTTFDVTGKVIAVQDLGGQLDYSYNNFNELHKVVDENGNILSEYEYDDFGRQKALIDINAGRTTYSYNAFDELISQNDAKNNTTKIIYDNLGRIETKTITHANDDPINYAYTYKAFDNNGALKLDTETGPNGYSKSYSYDEFGRLSSYADNIDDKEFITSQTYDTYGNVQSITYPGNFKVTNYYDDNTGTFYKANSGSKILYQLEELNHFGQVKNYTYNSSFINVSNTYNEIGLPYTVKAINNNGSLFNMEYLFNKNNSTLFRRKDVNNSGVNETFSYDDLQRLTHVKGTKVVNYNSNGNIDYKQDAGTYTYDQPDGKINAVSGISNDNNAIPLLTECITYTAFDRPESIVEGNKSYQLYYGPDNQRKKTVYNENGGKTTRYYSGSYELITTGGCNISQSIYYLSFANSVDVIYYKENPAAAEDCRIVNSEELQDEFYYVFTDYLGSILKVVDGNGNTKEEQSFDAWGRKRNPVNWQVYNKSEDALPQNLTWLNRGYTGHEHLYQFGIINMNNRLYDPIVGRMLAVDNFVVDSESTQAFNRYTYAMNNPLKFTDPNGDIPLIAIMAIAAVVSVTTNGINNAINQDPFFYNASSAAFWGAAQGAFSFGIGGSTAPFGFGNVISHGHLGGVMTAAQGGNYTHGFLSGTSGALVGAVGTNINNGALRFGVSTLGAGVVGGGASSLAGGNFWDGFRNGLISASLNHLYHSVEQNYWENFKADLSGKKDIKKQIMKAFKKVQYYQENMMLKDGKLKVTDIIDYDTIDMTMWDSTGDIGLFLRGTINQNQTFQVHIAYRNSNDIISRIGSHEKNYIGIYTQKSLHAYDKLLSMKFSHISTKNKVWNYIIGRTSY